MRRQAKRRIDAQEAAYIELLLRTPDPEAKKQAMQRLCRLYRQGYALQHPHPIILTLLGCLYSEFEKVCRWALNCLALLGTTQEVSAIVDAIERYRHLPDIVGAGISALTAIVSEDRARNFLKNADIPLDNVALLAAAQQSKSFAKELRGLSIDIDRAAASELRFATVLVGIDAAPDNLFSRKYSNGQIIGELNRHPDTVVAQYSVWAICENPALNLQHLRVPLVDIASLPSNVRKYVYQLVTADSGVAKKHYDVLVMGSEDPARAG